MKGLINNLLNPFTIFIAGLVIAMLIALILFTINPDFFLDFFTGFAPK